MADTDTVLPLHLSGVLVVLSRAANKVHEVGSGVVTVTEGGGPAAQVMVAPANAALPAAVLAEV